ncbi:hypothetical protein TanjilG_10329 [Lupinus angustifolius]|uniref:Importin N-terminal domain-containing protein n=1 Tax=Lupinus angustifolius TaxID=3871 RepID=A0A4P1R491_LUPAN|nr:hypothetical protein TanjilG_10329 [Lupinus angustifolius]
MALSASDVAAMYSLLSNSMNADHLLRRPAEEALAQSESRPGFCSCLIEVITAKDLASQVDVRLMATVYFKNNVNRYWRQRRNSSGISNEEKMHLRQKLLMHLREEDDQIALMLAVLISKIARIDYPKEWPDIFLVLSQQLQSADVLASHRIFMILFRTLKELSTKRLTSDQRNFAEISSRFFDYSWRLWQSDVQTILHGFSALSQSYNSNAEDQHHELYLTYSSFQKQYPKLWDFVMRASTKLMKILVAFQGRHPYSFGDKFVISSVMDFCLNKITDPEPYLLSFEQFLIQCMIMIKNILECNQYKPSLTGRVIDENGITLEQMKKNISGAVGGVLTSLLPNERIVFLCNVLITREPFVLPNKLAGEVRNEIDCGFDNSAQLGLNLLTLDVQPQVKICLVCMIVLVDLSGVVGEVMTRPWASEKTALVKSVTRIFTCVMWRYFVLTARDLEEWYRNPEAFHHEQDMVQWTEKLRPCAEALYIILFENNSQLLAPVVVSLLQETMNNCPTSVTEITPALLLKDAAYGAASYVYYELSNYLSFKDWFNGALSHELSNEHPNLRIIHRKVAVILGQWVSEIKDDTKRPVYCALIRLLQDKDLSVRLAACRSLCLHIEDANFSEREFIDLLPICWDSCFTLVEEVQEFDSKVQVLNLISILIGHVTEVIPFANKLVQFFQKVWEESSGESLLQIQLLVALRNFVIALGYQSPICYSILLPILEHGIDINNPDELNLLEDSMLVAVNIIEDYIILGGNDFLGMHATSIAKILDLVVGNVNDKGLLSVLPVIDILIQCFPMEVPPFISSTLQKLIVICLSGGDDCDPSKTSVKASSAAILARLLVMNTNSLAQLASDSSTSLLLQAASIPVQENILLCLVDIWVDKVDHVSSIQKKTIGLALSIILTLRLPEVIDKVDQILSVCTSVILGGKDDLTEEESRLAFCA